MTLEEKIVERKKIKSEWHMPEIGVYHASGVFDICSGKMKVEDFFKEEEFSDTTLAIFAIGDMYHDFIQKLFPDYKKEYIIKLSGDGYKIVGRADMISPEGKIIELKTCSKLPEQPYLAHRYQVQCYMEALGKDEATIVYIEKNPKGFPTIAFTVKYDKEIMDDIYLKVAEFNKQLHEIQSKVR